MLSGGVYNDDMQMRSNLRRHVVPPRRNGPYWVIEDCGAIPGRGLRPERMPANTLQVPLDLAGCS